MGKFGVAAIGTFPMTSGTSHEYLGGLWWS